MTEIMATPLLPLSSLGESASQKPCYRSFRPKICILPAPTESKATVQSPLYKRLTGKEEVRAYALVSALRDVDCELDDQLECINLRDDKKRLKVVCLGDPSNSPCMLNRGRNSFYTATTLALQETKCM